METIARILELMGATPDHVAATLRGANVIGHRKTTSYMNPLIRYLKQNIELDAYLELDVDGTALRMFSRYEIQEIELPAPVRGIPRTLQSRMLSDTGSEVIHISAAAVTGVEIFARVLSHMVTSPR